MPGPIKKRCRDCEEQNGVPCVRCRKDTSSDWLPRGWDNEATPRPPDFFRKTAPGDYNPDKDDLPQTWPSRGHRIIGARWDEEDHI